MKTFIYILLIIILFAFGHLTAGFILLGALFLYCFSFFCLGVGIFIGTFSKECFYELKETHKENVKMRETAKKFNKELLEIENTLRERK